jgi:spindle assembly checkpoint component MAD3
MQVFVDPSGASAEEALAAGDAGITPWNELGSRKERVKENVPKVSKLSGTTLRQPGRQQRVTSAPAASTSRIAVFRDPAPGDGGDVMPPPLAAPGTKVRGKEREIVPKTPARSTIVPFKDEVKETPATPRFMPFKDDVVSVFTIPHGELHSQRESQPSTPSTSSGAQVPESVMKAKIVGTRGALASSEAEALRKDPFKNYPDSDKPRPRGDGDD